MNVIVFRCIFILMVLFVIDSSAIAGTDATFNMPLTKVSAWMTGTLGKLMALCALAVGLGIGIVKQSVMAVAVGVGLALAASAGPAVLTGIFSAVI